MTRDQDVVPMTQELPTGPRRRRGRALLWVLLGLLVLAGAALGTAALLPVSEEAPAGTTVAGVAMGGLSRTQVREAIAGPLGAQVGRAVQLRVTAPKAGLDETVEIDPVAAGITLDRAATERAVFTGAPQSLLDRIRDRRSTARRDVAPVIAVDTGAARELLTAKLGRFTVTARDATVQVPTPSPVLAEKGDASFTARDAPATVEPARTGTEVDLKAALAALRAAVENEQARARLTVAVTDPKVSTAEASAVDQLIGSFTTEHPCCAPRVTNIHRIAELVDGTVIAPGATFSLNAAAGRRTAENGFVSAPAIADGELVDQFGGGVSQFSTTLFNAAWFAGLEIPKHQPHSKYISRYPPGREATLDYDTIDQTIHNTTDAPVVIRTFTTGTAVTVSLYGHTGDREVTSTTGPRTPRTGGGFSISVERVVRDDGSETSRRTLNWSYTGLD